jgi:hypothetical protein
MIGRELVKRGVEVSAVVPRRAGQRPVEELDGMTVRSFPMSRPWQARELFRQCDADIYHSQHPSYSTSLALDAMPDRKHLITFRDPKMFRDWVIASNPSLNYLRSFRPMATRPSGERAYAAPTDAPAPEAGTRCATRLAPADPAPASPSRSRSGHREEPAADGVLRGS